MATEESKVEAIFFAAIEKQSPEDRAAYLEEVCANDESLRQRVEALLNAQPKLGNFLQGNAADMVATSPPPPVEYPGTQIGPYKLLQQIGEGGMGVVYMASRPSRLPAAWPSRSSSRGWIRAKLSPGLRPSGRPWQ
jgi:hypothetical protein